MLRHRLAIGLLILAFVPISAFAFIKPLRVISPELVVNLSCYEGKICTDDITRLSDARAMYYAATARAEAKAGKFQSVPKITFCSTLDCFTKFSSIGPAAITVGTLGVVVAPRGWKEFYVVHELLHYRQAEELGVLSVWLGPSWIIEGMAYSMSEDPRRPLTQPFESWRSRFEQWRVEHRHADLWPAVRDAM